jgi:hypothetical protein
MSLSPAWEAYLEKLTQFVNGNNVLDAPASNTDGVLWETHEFLHLCWIGLFWANRAYLCLETSMLQEVFFSKTKSMHTCINVQDAPVTNTDGFLSRHSRHSCFSSTYLNTPIYVTKLGTKWAFLHLENSDLQ